MALRGFLSGRDSGHLWFLPALFWCIIVFVLIRKILLRWNTNSLYVLLIITGVIQLIYSSIPINVLGLKNGLAYIFYYGIGYVFQYERAQSERWNSRTIVFAYILMLACEVINKKYGLFDQFFTILLGSFMTYIFADICSRVFTNIRECYVWKIIVRNLFYVYLFHDPLEYVVLRVFMNNSLLSSAVGCLLYSFMRIFGVIIISIALGESIRYVKRFNCKMEQRES